MWHFFTKFTFFTGEDSGHMSNKCYYGTAIGLNKAL